MKTGIIGRKLGMTQLFREDGSIVPVTVLEVGPCPVSAVRTHKEHGYSAVQLAFEKCRPKVISRAEVGHLADVKLEPYRHLREFRLTEDSTLAVGEMVTIAIFAEGDHVDVSGISKGHGFTGGMVRHGWKGGRASRGSMFHRRIGSSGASAFPSRVLKGKTMPGHMGHARHKSIGLLVAKVDAERNLLYVKGAVAGPTGGLVTVVPTARASKKKK
jgi:large subunit ribosomal protein L3